MLMKASDILFTERGMSPDIILNPNAIPSRMTIGQLIECILGKVSALEGHEGDGTPFGDIDVEETKNKLEKLGFHRDGVEVMYNGMTGQKLKIPIFIGPTYYHRLKHLVEDKIHCLTMDHEVLTHDGWKSYSELSLKDRVATLKDGRLVYDHPTKILYYPEHKGKIYHVVGDMIDLKVTEEHRMWVGKHGKFQLIPINELGTDQTTYKKDARWACPDYSINLTGIKGPHNMNALLFIFGLWYRSGCTSIHSEDHYSTVIRACPIDVRPDLERAYKDSGYEYSEDHGDFTCQNNSLYRLLNKMNDNEKGLPEWVWSLSAKQSGILLDALLSAIEYPSSSNEQFSDDVMRLALHAGWSSNKTHIKGSEWYINLVRVENSPEASVVKITEEAVPVFCLQVPSEVFYVRRNGKGVWTGNSRARGPRTILTRQPPEGRSREGGLRLGEMERDAILGHGLAKYLKEKLLDTSDAYSTHVCNICGLFAQRLYRKESKKYVTNHDIFYCVPCKNYTQISKVMIPYAFKLLIQELMSLNIAPRIRIKQTIFTG